MLYVLVGLVAMLVVPALLAHLMAGVQRSAARQRWLTFEEELSIEPEVAYKTAQVLVAVDGGSALLSGVTEGRPYRPDEDAACRRQGCRPPGLDCVCGFYAFRDRREAQQMLGRTLGYYGVRPTALLTVELDGELLEYERGFRAGHQRVVEVAFTAACDLCERFGRHREAQMLAASATFVPRRFTGLGRPMVRIPEGYLPVRPVCDEHVPGDAAARLLDPGCLTGLLGAEVHWMTPPGHAGARPA